MKNQTTTTIDGIPRTLQAELHKLHRLFTNSSEVSNILRTCFSIFVALILGLVTLSMPDTAHATVKFKFSSDAKTSRERNAEKKELHKAISEVSESDKFLRKLFRRLNRRAPNAIITIVYGDSTKHTKKDASGGTFIPDWEDPDKKTGERVLKGGTLIIDKTLLTKLRPGHAYSKFLAEVISHELWHAYEASVNVDNYNEDLARLMGEEVATELGYKTLDETRPPPTGAVGSAKGGLAESDEAAEGGESGVGQY